MKNNKFEKNKSNISTVKNRYCIFLENAGQRTKGRGERGTESSTMPSRNHRVNKG